MKNCAHCSLQRVCKIYEAMQKEMTEGLTTGVLTPTDNGNTTYAHQAIFSGLARSCNLYQSFDAQDYLKDKIKDIDLMVLELKNDKDFVDDFLNAPSPEHRAKLVGDSLDEDDILQKIQDLPNPEDNVEYVINYILSQFGL